MHFADNPYYMLKAYVDSQEGIDRAGGFAIQVSTHHHSAYDLSHRKPDLKLCWR